MCVLVAALTAGAGIGAESAAAGNGIPLAGREWAAYRVYHNSFKRFEREQRAGRYGSLRMRLKVTPRKRDLPIDGMSIVLASASIERAFDVDPLAGADLPLLQTAYDEDGVLRLNRAKGDFAFSTQYSVIPSTNGSYDPAWLRQACEQGLEAKKSIGLAHRLAVWGKRCAGVTFQARDRSANRLTAEFRDEFGVLRPLPVKTLPYFGGGTTSRVVQFAYRFGEWPHEGTVVTAGGIDVIDFIFE
jgi:hypothetical protein